MIRGDRQLRRTTLLLVGSLALLAGVGLSRLDLNFGHVWYIALAVTVLSLKHRHIFIVGLFVVALFWLGWWRGISVAGRLAVYDQLYSRKITISAVADNDAVYDSKGQISFEVRNVTLENGTKIGGKLQLSGFGSSSIYKGDRVRATGKLYPTQGSKQARMSYAKLQLLARQPNLVNDIRRKFASGLQTALPDPLSAFALGILVGQRSTLPDATKQDLLMVGLTHIIAVSGYNLTIILRATENLLKSHSKKLSTLLAFSLIALFLLLTGSSASIVRAAIVSALSITATYYGRSIRPLLLIVLPAAITAWANPVYVWQDAGWYLSFLAFYGVLVVAPVLRERLQFVKTDSLILMVALESLCAELMTLPYVLYVFGQLSFVGLAANILVVPLIPLAMLLSVIAGMAGMLISPIATWFAWPAKTLLNYILDIAHVFAGLPNSFADNVRLQLPATIALYALILALTAVLAHKTKRLKTAIVTDKK